MKKILFLALSVFILGMTSVSAADFEKCDDIKLYINDEIQQIDLYTSDNTYVTDYTVPYFVPLEKTVTGLGENIEFSPNGITYIVRENPPSAALCFNDGYLSYERFWDEKPNEPGELTDKILGYYEIDGTGYIDISNINLISKSVVIREKNDVYIYSYDYYLEKYYKYKDSAPQIGKIRDDSLYVNEKKQNLPIYTAFRHYSNAGNASGEDYIALRTFTDEMGYEIGFQYPNIVTVKNTDGSEFEIKAKYSYISEGDYAQIYDGCEREVYIVDGVTYIKISDVCDIFGFYIGFEDEDSIKIYSSDYVRTDIPQTMDEVYKYLDETLSPEEIDYIKNNDTANLHHSFGRNLRNDWIYPLFSSSDLRFINEIPEKYRETADDISSYIIEEYKKYLEKNS